MSGAVFDLWPPAWQDRPALSSSGDTYASAVTTAFMKAVVVHSPGDPEELQVTSVPVPRPGPNQVLVRVQAATVGRTDTGVRSGSIPAGFPLVVGSDAAGDVVLVGSGVTECSPGGFVPSSRSAPVLDRPGGHADYVVVPASELHPIPDNVSCISSVSVGRPFSRAWRALFGDGRLGPNERVVVIGAADPVGIAAIQICRWKGSPVIAVSDGRHAQRLQAIGATRVVSQSAPHLPKHVRTGLGHQGASAIVNVLGTALAASLEILDQHGRLVFLGGDVPQMLDIHRLVELDARVSGSAAGADGADVRHIHKLLSEATFVPVIDSIYSLSQVGQAHRRAESEERFGAILLVPDYLDRSAEKLTKLFEED